MIPVLPLASGLRRDLAHVRADERAAANAGDALRAMTRCIEASALDADIAEAESPEALAAFLGAISMVERIGA